MNNNKVKKLLNKNLQQLAILIWNVQPIHLLSIIIILVRPHQQGNTGGFKL